MQKRFIKNVMQRFLPPTMTITGRFSWGLIYAESFLEHFAEARTYASQLISCAIDHEEKHIAIHQAGMIERMLVRMTRL